MSDSEASEDDVCWSDTDSHDEQTAAGTWKHINSNQVRVQVDDVDTLLLVKAREEEDYVVKRLLQRMFGTTQHNKASVSVSRILLTWLDPPILSKLQQFVNVILNEAAAVTVDELYKFLEVKLWLSCYRVPPGFFFDKDNQAQYPPSQHCMSYERYRTILKALGTTRDHESEGSSQWTAPFTTDRNTANRSLCTTYKAYQNHRQTLPSFAAFCREAAVSLSERPSTSRPLSTISDNTLQTSTFELGATFVYKKRLHFETEKEWIKLRLSKTTTHLALLLADHILDPNRRRTAAELRSLLSANHDIENQDHSRLGFKTSFECVVCKVSLCRTKRWEKDQSCFERFHSDRKLPNPCKNPQHLKSTKSNENRAKPPSRKRSTSLDAPNLRVPSVCLSSKKRRYSSRLKEVCNASARLQ